MKVAIAFFSGYVIATSDAFTLAISRGGVPPLHLCEVGHNLRLFSTTEETETAAPETEPVAHAIMEAEKEAETVAIIDKDEKETEAAAIADDDEQETEAVAIVDEDEKEIEAVVPATSDQDEDRGAVAPEMTDENEKETEAVALAIADEDEKETEAVATAITDKDDEETEAVATTITDEDDKETEAVATTIADEDDKETEAVATTITDEDDEETEAVIPVMTNEEAKEAPATTEGKKAPDAPPEMLGWDTHKPIDEAPITLVRDADGGPDGNYPMRSKFEKMIRDAQIKITAAIEGIDGQGKFQEDCWTRENGGGGMSRVLTNGKVFEKAGVNLSVVYGSMPQEALQAATERGVDRAKGMAPGERVPFFACGLSSVMHPRNPFCPTMHFNYRYFETDGGVWWFGGGTDITPAYLNEDDMKHFHGTYKEVCDRHDPNYYEEFKAWADRYFLIKHRGETRGLGGIFFDDQNDRDPEQLFEFAKDALDNVVTAYGPIIEKHKDDEFTEQQKQWQLMRRGRYVEFNLVYDRGTVFGLKTGGRIESILMSLPETARWEYDHQVVPGSPEAQFLEVCKNPREWV